MDTDEMCFSDREVNIVPNGVFNGSGITALGTFFTGESSFNADDVEVLMIKGKNRNQIWRRDLKKPSGLYKDILRMCGMNSSEFFLQKLACSFLERNKAR